MISQSPCNLCGAREAEDLARLDRHGKPLRTVICRKCGLVWSDPVPTEETLRQFYAEEYRLQYKGISRPTPEHVYRAGRVAIHRFRYLKKILKPGSAIVDVGSSTCCAASASTPRESNLTKATPATRRKNWESRFTSASCARSGSLLQAATW